MIIKERFSNKVAIVTGGADGIGKGIAYRLGQEGATVILFDINRILLEKTVAEFHRMGIQASGNVVDISNETEVSQAVTSVEDEWGRIDVLVNSAGIVGRTNTKI